MTIAERSNRGVVLHKDHSLKLEAIAHPGTPGEGQVLISVKATGICGSDLHLIKGEWPAPYPYTIGHESSGIVAEIGTGDCNGLKVGDRVAIEPIYRPEFIGGTTAKFFMHDAKRTHKMADAVSFEEGAFVEPLAVALHAVRRGGVGKAPDSRVVFILGAGPIGQMALLSARAEGAKWVGVLDMRQDRLDAALTMGANAIVQTDTSMSTEDVALKIKSTLPMGTEIDVVVDAIGAVGTLNIGLAVVRALGVVVDVGMSHGIAHGLTLKELTARELDLRGSFCYGPDYPDALELIASGKVDVKSLITHRLPLEEFGQGFKILLEGKDSAVKVMFSF